MTLRKTGDGAIHPQKPKRSRLILSDVSALGTDTAVVISGRSLLHKNEKTPYGYVVEIATKKMPEYGLENSMPVFLPYDKPKIRKLRDEMRKSPFYMAEVSFTNLQFHRKRNGDCYATADDFTIIKGELK